MTPCTKSPWRRGHNVSHHARVDWTVIARSLDASASACQATGTASTSFSAACEL